MDALSFLGALSFGVVVGWITYRTLRRTQTSGLSDIATVIGILGGAAVLKLFPQEGGLFSAYSIGVAAGFFLYLIIAAIVPDKINLWMGEAVVQRGGGDRGGNGDGNGDVQRPPGHVA